MERSSLVVTTADGVRIALDRYRPAQPRPAALIVCPGFFQSKDTPTFQRLAQALAEDCDVLCMDFRGHGRSGGLFTFSAREPLDLEAVLAWAAPQYPRLGLMGFSLGGATAIVVASRHAEVQALVAVSAPSAFEEIEFQFWTPAAMRTGLTGLEPGAGCRPGNPWEPKERPVDRIAALSPRPLLLVHGTKDAIVRAPHSERLYATAGEPKQLLRVRDGGHAEELFRRQAPEFLPPVRAWLRTALIEKRS